MGETRRAPHHHKVKGVTRFRGPCFSLPALWSYDDRYGQVSVLLAEILLKPGRIPESSFRVINETHESLAVWMDLVSSNVDQQFVPDRPLIHAFPGFLHFHYDLFLFQ